MGLVQKIKAVRQANLARSKVTWRIQLIPFEESKQTGFVFLLPALGTVGLIAGLVMIGLVVVFHSGNNTVWLGGNSLVVLGLVVMFGGLWLCAKRKRRGWKTVAARCVDRELREVMSADAEGGWGWRWRIKCEYNYLGTEYAVTPRVGWSDFGSKHEALKYLEKRIFANGECRLLMNPQIPFQTELFGCDIVDKLFFR